ncbi:class I SAM-dependent methyltransferase [Membranihabitans marinus]|uniref:class I SAM-dependent methyltransferase n=1 Tax=Membranihabitans marinus TaxID=1227546 RepID=UPI001F463D18|nr:class I SAM-dependent methyltransferase [Membranihabitans marinus]
MQKSSLDEIRQRFDNDVERFSNLDTGQKTTIDAPFTLELITSAAQILCPNADQVLDIGCGAGNYTVKLLSKLPNLNCSLVDLSQAMLDKAKERVENITHGQVNIQQQDILQYHYGDSQLDIVLAGAVLHHLRSDGDWQTVFTKIYKALKPGGCLFVVDLIEHESSMVSQFIWNQYGEYLIDLGGESYKDDVLAYIDKEDSPRSLNFQMKTLYNAGFSTIDILHKNLCFGAYVAIK